MTKSDNGGVAQHVEHDGRTRVASAAALHKLAEGGGGGWLAPMKNHPKSANMSAHEALEGGRMTTREQEKTAMTESFAAHEVGVAEALELYLRIEGIYAEASQAVAEEEVSYTSDSTNQV